MPCLLFQELFHHSTASLAIADTCGNLPIHVAITHGNRAVVTDLIARGSDVQLANASGHRPLHLAARSGDYAIFTALFRATGEVVHVPDAQGQDVLHYAMEGGNMEVVQQLFLRGARGWSWSGIDMASVSGRCEQSS